MEFKRLSGLISIALGVAFIIFSIYFIQGEEASSTRGSGLRLFLVLGVILLIVGSVRTFSRKECKEKISSPYCQSKEEVCIKKSESELHDLITQRAQEIYEQRGKEPGHQEEDWLQAEMEIRKKFKF